MNGLPPFSNEPVAGGHFTNSATRHSPTSANKERPLSCSRPRADTKTHARSLFTPNQETKRSRNSHPRLINSGGLDEPPLWDATLSTSGKG